ncbi:hypothetical protein [Desulfonatronum parangueonense]
MTTITSFIGNVEVDKYFMNYFESDDSFSLVDFRKLFSDEKQKDVFESLKFDILTELFGECTYENEKAYDDFDFILNTKCVQAYDTLNETVKNQLKAAIDYYNGDNEVDVQIFAGYVKFYTSDIYQNYPTIEDLIEIAEVVSNRNYKIKTFISGFNCDIENSLKLLLSYSKAMYVVNGSHEYPGDRFVVEDVINNFIYHIESGNDVIHLTDDQITRLQSIADKGPFEYEELERFMDFMQPYICY